MSSNNSSDKPYQLSSNVSATSNFVVEKWIRQRNVDHCVKEDKAGTVERCVCRLGGTPPGTLEDCESGFSALRNHFRDKQSPSNNPLDITPVSWCVNNIPNLSEEKKEAWLIGCVNAIRKD